MEETTAHNQKPGMTARFIWRAIVLLILAATVVGGILYWNKADHGPQAVQSSAQQQAVPVHILTMQPKTVPLKQVFLGQTESSQTVEIRARVNGFLESKHFTEGGHVKAGQLLFSIDPRSFQAALDMTKAQLASAQAQLERINQQLKRYTALRQSGSATEDELNELQTDQSVALANIELEKARIVQTELDLSYTKVESPIDGLIGMAQKDVGSYVDNTSGGLLAVVEKIDPIYVRYTVSEQDLLQAKRMAQSGETNQPGIQDMRLEITLADGSKYAHAGTISYTAPQIDTDTGSAVVRGTFPNPDGELMPGQFVHVNVEGVERLNALKVPKGAVIQNPTGAMVYVADDAMKAEIRPITLGPWQDDMWIVESGLHPGDKVIVDQIMHLRPGMTVSQAPDEPAAQADGSQPKSEQ